MVSRKRERLAAGGFQGRARKAKQDDGGKTSGESTELSIAALPPVESSTFESIEAPRSALSRPIHLLSSSATSRCRHLPSNQGPFAQKEIFPTPSEPTNSKPAECAGSVGVDSDFVRAGRQAGPAIGAVADSFVRRIIEIPLPNCQDASSPNIRGEILTFGMVCVHESNN